MWEEVTIPVYGRHPRYGAKAGKPNPHFLNAEVFVNKFLSRYIDAGVLDNTGPFVFQFQALPKREASSPQSFIERLDSFLAQLPQDFNYATEVRNQEILVPEYFSALSRHNVTHCFNHWTSMPPLVDQMKAAAAGGGIGASFLTSRILTPIGVSYQQAVERFTPYDSIKIIQEQMRADVARLAKRAVQRAIPVYVLVNNRCEGYAPGTIDAIGSEIVENLDEWLEESADE